MLPDVSPTFLKFVNLLLIIAFLLPQTETPNPMLLNSQFLMTQLLAIEFVPSSPNNIPIPVKAVETLSLTGNLKSLNWSPSITI